MQHKTSSVEVFFSTEYARFRMINGNRQLNELRIKKITNDIKEGNDMLRYYPIHVRQIKDRLEILDGQHRFFVCRNLKLPVFYMLINENKQMIEIARVNSNVGKWKPADFINCYTNEGNKNYVLLDEFLQKYSFPLSVSLNLLAFGVPGADSGARSVNEEFQRGYFKAKELEKANELAFEISKFKAFSMYRTRPFIVAVHKIKEAGLIEIDDLVKAVNKRPEMLIVQGNYKNYINVLEQIINVNKQKRVLII